MTGLSIMGDDWLTAPLRPVIASLPRHGNDCTPPTITATTTPFPAPALHTHSIASFAFCLGAPVPVVLFSFLLLLVLCYHGGQKRAHSRR